MVRMIMEMVGNRSFTLTKRQKKQVTTPQERRPKGICPGTSSLHLYLWLANHRFQKVCICWRSSNHAWSGAGQRHDNCR